MMVESSKALVSVDGRPAERPAGEYTLRVEQEVVNFLIPE
jgi:hypothetical protein